jgi:RluA family pseudouridine synthase
LDLESRLLHLDEHLLVLDKPSGLAVLPEGWDAAAPHVRSLLEPLYGPLWIVHRLDKETSGVLLLARSAQAHRDLNGQFEGRRVEKVYHALASGDPAWQEQAVSLPLRANVGRRHRTAVDPERGKPAETTLRVLERFGDASLVEAAPHTGRTHQIRVHLWALGHPVLGDPLYTLLGAPDLPAKRSGALPLERLGLHALSLAIAHPLTGARVQFRAPYPPEFSAALEKLRGRAA